MTAAQPRVPLAERTAEALLARIRAGEWAPGDRLPGETTLAAQLGVGRSTVREAIRSLAARGILLPRHGSGVYLTEPDTEHARDTLILRSTIRTVLEARLAIEAE
ncbi:FadR/GntR family transcriptional regulator, partial [Leucobacter sp. M11]|uniref:FadR/GntR family transcriptional regulator n=1 Tax=Leucobacter sp. M11 TaxID=2993565 RepID=UPI002D7FE558